MPSSSQLTMLKVYFHKICMRIAKVFFPFIEMKSLLEFSSNEYLFEKFTKPKSFIKLFLLIFLVVMVVSSGLKIPITQQLRPFRSQAFAKIGPFIIINESFSSFEVAILHIWLFTLNRVGSPNENVHFVRLLNKLEPEDDKKILSWLKFILVQFGISSFTLHFNLMMYEAFTSTQILQSIVSIIYCASYYSAIQIFVRNVFILYFYCYAGFKVTLGQITKLKTMIERTDHSVDQMINLYLNLLESISQLNYLSVKLLSNCNLLAIPNSSLLIMILITPMNGFIINSIKCLIVIISASFATRGYFLVSILSKIDGESKKLAKNIYSAISRNKFHHIDHVKQFLVILEDLSCERRLIVVRELNSPVTQMDVFNSIVSTVSLITLIFSLRNSF